MAVTAEEELTPEEDLTASIVIVPPASRMDRETFAKHMTLRHSDSLGGLSELPGNLDERVLECYQAFHHYLHRYRLHLAHEHEADW